MPSGVNTRTVCFKVIAGLGCAAAVVVPLLVGTSALLTFMGHVVTDAIQTTGRSALKAYQEKRTEESLAEVRVAARPMQSVALATSAGAGAAIPGPAGLTSTVTLVLFDHRFAQVLARQPDGDPAIAARVMDATGVIPLFGPASPPQDSTPPGPRDR